MNDNFNEFDNKNIDSSSFNLNNVDDNIYTKKHDEIIQDTPVNKHQSDEKSDFSSTDNHYSSSYNGAGYTTNSYHNNYHSNSSPYNTGYNYYNQPIVNKPKSKKAFGAGTVIVASLLAAVIGAVSGIGAVMLLDDKSPINKIINNDVAQMEGNSNVNINIDKTVESVVEAVAEKVSPSVVGIRTTTSVANFFGGSSEETGEGSGVIYSSDGYIITNYHVIQNVVSSSTDAKIEVFLNNNTEKSYAAEVIGYHISSDLAVIKINGKNLPAVTIADSADLKAGQYVIAIGNPGGLEFMGSVTYGVISGLDRVVSTSSGITLIQTDAAINPGNSGGALLNTSGELIGINSSKIVAEEYEGMGFAIPSNTVVEKCQNIINRKDIAEPYVGITISEKYTAEVLNYYGYPVGAVVLSVDNGSPADKMGIRKGDIITEFDGKKITNYDLFEEYLRESEPNTTVKIKIYRSGRYYSADLPISSSGSNVK